MTTTTELTALDMLVRILGESSEPVTYAQIKAHPLWSGNDRILTNALNRAIDAGVVTTVGLGVYALTDTARR